MKIARCDKMFCHVKEKAPKTEISIKLCESRDVICSALDGTWHQQCCQIGSDFPAQSSNPDWQAQLQVVARLGRGNLVQSGNTGHQGGVRDRRSCTLFCLPLFHVRLFYFTWAPNPPASSYGLSVSPPPRFNSLSRSRTVQHDGAHLLVAVHQAVRQEADEDTHGWAGGANAKLTAV